MKKVDIPVTSAVRFLREKNVHFEPHFYNYEEHGGTRVASAALSLPEHCAVKTIVMETEEKTPLIVLMHGDLDVSTKMLARRLGVKSVQPCDERTAQRLTGYVFGGMSPFGTRIPIEVYAERTIFALDKIYINGGKRGFILEINPADLRVLPVKEVEVGVLRGQ